MLWIITFILSVLNTIILRILTFPMSPFLASSLIMAFFFLSFHLVLINGMHLPQVSSVMSWNSPDLACRDSTSFTFPFYFKSFSEPRCKIFCFPLLQHEFWIIIDIATIIIEMQKCSLIAILKESLNIFLRKKLTLVFPFPIGCSNKQSWMLSKHFIPALHLHAKPAQST